MNIRKRNTFKKIFRRNAKYIAYPEKRCHRHVAPVLHSPILYLIQPLLPRKNLMTGVSGAGSQFANPCSDSCKTRFCILFVFGHLKKNNSVKLYAVRLFHYRIRDTHIYVTNLNAVNQLAEMV